MMHIWFLSNEYPYKDNIHGGIGSFLGSICPNLVSLGHRVTVLGVGKNKSDKRYYIDGVEIYDLHCSNWSVFR